MRRLLAAACLVLAAVPARAGFFGRSKLVSRWAAASIPVNGDDAEWSDESAFEEDGLAVMAMNDASNLYLLITAHTSDARDYLTGESRRDVTLWFVGPDGKTRDWGARLPFSRRTPLTNSLHDPAGLDPESELVRYSGAQVSSDTLPGDVIDRLAAVSRRPIWELKIPLKRLAVDPEKAVAVDFILAAPPNRRPRPARPAESGEGDEHGEHGGRGGRKGASADHQQPADEQAWNALSYSLSVRLAPDPSLPR
jgi:hypothetical protein